MIQSLNLAHYNYMGEHNKEELYRREGNEKSILRTARYILHNAMYN